MDRAGHGGVSTLIPKHSERPLDATGLFSLPWRRWLEAVNNALNAASDGRLGLAADVSALATTLGSPDGTVANVPAQDWLAPFSIRAGDGVAVSGTPSSGVVTISAMAAGLPAVMARIALRVR